MPAKKALSTFATATNDEKRKNQHRIRQFFSSLLSGRQCSLLLRRMTARLLRSNGQESDEEHD
jgi:hypothetical protein